MKQFFEQYGAVALGILALIVLIAMITPVGNLIKTSLQGTVQTFSAGIESQSNAIDFVTIDSGTRIKIGDKHYIVLEKMGLTQFKVLERASNGEHVRWNMNNTDGNTYDGSNIDNYLSTYYYDALPSDIKNAIVDTVITQKTYYEPTKSLYWESTIKTDENGSWNGWWYNKGTLENPEWIRWYKNDEYVNEEREPAYPWSKWTKTNIETEEIVRKVFLPSLEEIEKAIDMDNNAQMLYFTKNQDGGYEYQWTRDKSDSDSVIFLDYCDRSVGTIYVSVYWFGVRPAYTLDLSKVSFTIE